MINILMVETDYVRHDYDMMIGFIVSRALRPGNISEQYNVCGKKGCRCKDDPPEKHGPYYQISYTRKDKSRSMFIKKEKIREVESQVEYYRLLKKLVDCWTDLAIELADMKMKDKN
jgi:hypothetical protein